MILLGEIVIKKDILEKTSILSLSDAFKCGECLHFKNHPHSLKDDICSKQGVRACGIAPKCFTPNVTALTKNSDQFVQLASLFEGFTTKQQRLLLGLLKGVKKGKITHIQKSKEIKFPIEYDQNGSPIQITKKVKKKINFCTKVYFKIGDDYISNYLAAYAMGYTSQGELILMGSPDMRTRGACFIAYLSDTSSLLTYSSWKLKREQLSKNNRLFDPKNKIIKKATVSEDYNPPTIDNYPEVFQKSTKKKKSMDLVDRLSFTIS